MMFLANYLLRRRLHDKKKLTFWEKKSEKYFKIVSAEIFTSMLSVKRKCTFSKETTIVCAKRMRFSRINVSLISKKTAYFE